jgi:hypothetical protein
VRKTGRREKQDIWIVDELIERRDIFDEFLQGANDHAFTLCHRTKSGSTVLPVSESTHTVARGRL